MSRDDWPLEPGERVLLERRPDAADVPLSALGFAVIAVVIAAGFWWLAGLPNLTIGPMVLKALKPHSHLIFDVHLMIAPVDPYIGAFAEAGADIITVHAEVGPHIHRTLQEVRDTGCQAGISVNPGTPPEAVLSVLDLCDLVLVMSVNPGFGGQKFIQSQLAKIERIRAAIDAQDRPIRLEVDGGVTPDNAGAICAAGADTLVAGSAVFKGGPAAYADNIAALRRAGASA